MAGVLFVVRIPMCQHEKKLRKQTTNEDKKVMFDFNNKNASFDDLLTKNSELKANNSELAVENSALLKHSKADLTYIDMDSQSDSLNSAGKPLLSDDVNTAKDLLKTPTLLDLPKVDTSMEKNLEELLKEMKIDNAIWCPDRIENFYQVLFWVNGGDKCEEMLLQLHERGIGLKLHSVASVVPCSLYYDGLEHASSEDELSEDKINKKDTPSPSAWEKFVASVGARLTVAQVVERVKADACLNFDFLVLLLIAGVVATLGLIENSTVMLVASMLISPLMGPIMAGTFGFVIEDRRLRKMGILNELVGLFICLLVGFGIGLVVGLVADFWGTGDLPTEEMLSRGKVRSLYVGALIALPSGAAVAIALLGDKTGSLVGVAISASILPPAVNAGLLWALACINLAGLELEPSEEFNSTISSAPPTFVYSKDFSTELAILGAVSLCLTLVNILCIFVMGILVLKIKEVAPRTSGKQSQFWRHDIKIARDYNKTVNKEDGKLLQQQLADELAGLTEAELSGHHISPEITVSSQDYNHPVNLRILNISNRLLPRNQQTWSPSNEAKRLSLRELEDLYENLTGVTKRSHSPTRRSSSWIPSDPAGPTWYRSHISPPAGLPIIRETSSSFDGSVSKRRMTYASHDTPRPFQSNRATSKRFVVSPVEENEPL